MFNQQQEQLDVAGLTNLLRGASDGQVLSITASVCSTRHGLQDKILELLMQPPAQRFTGVIKSFFPGPRYGFIESQETFALYQKDVFLSGNEIGLFQPGQTVTFVVTQAKDGQPQANDLQDPNAQPMGGGMQMRQGGMHGGNQMQMQRQMGGGMQGQGGFQAAAMQKRNFNQMAHPNDGIIPQPKRGRCDPNAPRAIGTIKNFNLEKKFGFIESPDVTAQFGMDAFLSSMQIGNFQVGQTVSFAITVSAQGKPQAQDLQDAQGGQGIGQNFPQQAGGMGQQQIMNLTGGLDPKDGWTPALEQRMLDMANAGNDKDLDSLMALMGGMDGGGGVVPGGVPGAAPFTGDRAIGMINKFDINKKYGFIDCPQLKTQFGYDAFLSAHQIGSFDNGMTVSFDYQLKNGRPQASNLMPA